MALASAVVVLGCVLVFAGLVGHPGLGSAISDVVTPLSAATAAFCCSCAAGRSAGRLRLAWGLMTACSICWLGAETSWVVGSALPGLGIGLDDLLFLSSIPLGVAAMASFPAPRWQGADRLRAVMDGLIICGSVVFVARGLGVLQPGQGAWSVQLAALAYPLGDVLTLTVVLVAMIRAPRNAYSSLVLLGLGWVAYCVGDVVYAVQVRNDQYRDGTVLDITWILTYLLVALASLAPVARSLPRARVPAKPYRGRTGPWLVVGAALVAVVLVAATRPAMFAGDTVMTASCLFVLALFSIRQAWLFRDQERLNRRLTRESERRAQITGALLDGVLVVNEHGAVSFANPAAATLLGRRLDELGGTPVLDLVRTDGEDGVEVGDLLRALRGELVLSQGAATFVRPDGRDIPVELSVGPLDRRMPRNGVVVVFRDVSERRAVERMKNEFMSVISHELRTPLTSIRGAMALLDGGLGGSLAPTGARMVSIALQSSERISRLLNDILDVERLESGTLRLDLAAHEARALVEAAVHEMGGLAASSQVEVVVGAVEGCVRADDDRVVQTLTNLIGNAVKFSPTGGRVTVSARRVGEEVEFGVADHGRGIPADKLESVFDRFEQVDSSDSRQHGGTGLGLAICRNIVRLHGGRIWVTSTPGEGADFRFTLPSPRTPLPVPDPPCPRLHEAGTRTTLASS